jgi:hypothetical protein
VIRKARPLAWTLEAAALLVLTPLPVLATPLGAITRCPEGGQLRGGAPPEGFEQWCESTDLFGHVRKNGPWVAWHPNGQIRAEGEYVDGKENGLWQEFDTRGQLVSSRMFHFGYLTSREGRPTARGPKTLKQLESESRPVDRVAQPDAQSGQSATPSRVRLRSDFDDDDAGGAPALEGRPRTPRLAMSRRSSDDPWPFVYSAVGPGEGRATIAIGGRFLLYLPMLDFALVYGILNDLDLELRASSLGVASFLEAGAKYLVVGDDNLAFSVRGDLSSLAVIQSSEGGVVVGATPGAVLSMGNAGMQISIGFDVPIFFAGLASRGGASAAGHVGAIYVRPSLAIELLVSKTTALLVQGQLLVAADGSATIPTVGAGVGW